MQKHNEVLTLSAQQLLDEGLHCYNKKNLQGALYYFEHLFLLDKNNVDLIVTIVNILQELKEYKKAEPYINCLQNLAPNHQDYQFLEAENLFHLQRYVEATPLYLHLHNIHPLNTNLLQRLLTIYTKQNKRSEIKKVKALLADVESKSSHSQEEIAETVKVALQLVEQGMNEQAKTLLDGVLLFDSENVNANGIYGALLSDSEEYEQALFYLDKVAFASTTNYIDVYIKCLKEFRGSSSVINYLEKRISKYPQQYQAYKKLAAFYFDDEQYLKAYNIYKKIKKYFSKDLHVLKLSAMSRFMSINEDKRWMNRDKLAAAAEELYKVRKLLPDDEGIATQLINYNINIGEIKKAYDIVCETHFDNEDRKLWAKRSYYRAIRDRELYFKASLVGREERSLLIETESIEHKIWQGESLANKKVVILREQGIGDEILFASNYSWVIEHALQVDIFCSPRLANGFSRSFPDASFHSVIENGSLMCFPDDGEEYIKSADVVVLAGDLPALHYQAYGTPLHKEAYYLLPEATKKYWQEKLSSIVDSNKPKVGITWRSGRIDSSRSSSYLTEKEAAQIIAAIPEVEFFNCMYVDCEKEVKLINKVTKRELYKIPELDQKNDFENTAAMLSCLDLVVGAYTATVSLALAVGNHVVAYGRDYLKGDDNLQKEGLYYSNLMHVSLPILDARLRSVAISKIIENIRLKLNI